MSTVGFVPALCLPVRAQWLSSHKHSGCLECFFVLVMSSSKAKCSNSALVHAYGVKLENGVEHLNPGHAKGELVNSGMRWLTKACGGMCADDIDG